MLDTLKHALLRRAAWKAPNVRCCAALSEVSPYIYINNIDLSAVKIKGHGVRRFVLDRVNTFVVKGISASNVRVTFTFADAVHIVNLASGLVEVAYRAHSGVACNLTISVLISGVLHSEHLVSPGFTPATATDFLMSSHLAAFSDSWLHVIDDLNDNPQILGLAFERLYWRSRNMGSYVSSVSCHTVLLHLTYTVTSRHLRNSKLISILILCWKYMSSRTRLNWFLTEGLYVVMDTYKSCPAIQSNGCAIIEDLGRYMNEDERMLVRDRAVLACERAKTVCPFEAKEALRCLNRRRWE